MNCKTDHLIKPTIDATDLVSRHALIARKASFVGREGRKTRQEHRYAPSVPLVGSEQTKVGRGMWAKE
jgi:hypothetical protein